MASKYYHEMGQLEDVTRETRKEKRRRRRLKLGLSVDGASASATGNARGESIDDSSEEEESSSEADGFSERAEEDVDEEEGLSSDLFGERSDRSAVGDDGSSDSNDSDDESIDEWKYQYADQDMYKIFDGSALMAIGTFFVNCRTALAEDSMLGMLMQEYVADLVELPPASCEDHDGSPRKPRRSRTGSSKSSRQSTVIAKSPSRGSTPNRYEGIAQRQSARRNGYT